MRCRSVSLPLLVALLLDLCAVAQVVGPYLPGTVLPGTTGAGTVRKPTTGAGSVRKPTTGAGSVRKPTSSQGSVRKPTSSSDSIRKPASGYGHERKNTTDSGSSRKNTTDSGNSRKAVSEKDTRRQQTTTADRQNGSQNGKKNEYDKDMSSSGNKQVPKENRKKAVNEPPEENVTGQTTLPIKPNRRHWTGPKVRRWHQVTSGFSFNSGGVSVMENPKYDTGGSSRSTIVEGELPSAKTLAHAVYVKIYGIFDGKGMFVFDGHELSYILEEGTLPQGVIVNDEEWNDLTVPMKLNHNYSARSHCKVTKAAGRGAVQALKDDHSYAVRVDDSGFPGAEHYNFVVRFE